MQTDEREQFIGSYYDSYWPVFKQWYQVDQSLGLHLGLYEEGIKTRIEAVLNMNDFVGSLLELNITKKKKILDAGCGVGGTSIYLATKFPNVFFTGITIAPGQVQLATEYSKKRHVEKNTRFLLQNFTKTDFSDDTFDGAFAIESSTYAKNHKDFVDEMHRIIKPGGTLVIIDVFRTKKTLNLLMQKIFYAFCSGYGDINPPLLIEVKNYLQKKGFNSISMCDISKNASPALLKDFIITLPFFLVKMINSLLNLFLKRSHDDPVSSSRGSTVFAAILGLAGIIRYYAVSATIIENTK